MWIPIEQWNAHGAPEAIWGLNEAWSQPLPLLLELFIASNGKIGWRRVPDGRGFIRLAPTHFCPIPDYPSGAKIDHILNLPRMLLHTCNTNFPHAELPRLR